MITRKQLQKLKDAVSILSQLIKEQEFTEEDQWESRIEHSDGNSKTGGQL